MTTNFQLERIYLDNCTMGKFYHVTGKIKTFLAHTIELPYQSNQKRISCIPPGLYKLKRHYSRNHNWPIAYKLEGYNTRVGPRQLRTRILIHPANHHWELEGCIAPGLYLHDKQWGVSQSRKALKKIDKIYTDSPTSYLTII